MERPDVPAPAETTITLPVEPASAARARRFVADAIRASGDARLEDEALLCVTELVANVTVHTDSNWCTVTVVDQPDELLIEVADEAPKLPKLDPSPPGADHGRGLQIIDTLAGEWGVRRRADHGKCVWLRIFKR